MGRPLPKAVKKILKQNLIPPATHRFCIQCNQIRKFVYNRCIGHSECEYCGCRFAKKEKPNETINR